MVATTNQLMHWMSMVFGPKDAHERSLAKLEMVCCVLLTFLKSWVVLLKSPKGLQRCCFSLKVRDVGDGDSCDYEDNFGNVL